MTKTHLSQFCPGKESDLAVGPLLAQLPGPETTDVWPRTMDKRETMEQLFKSVWPSLSEKERRLFAAAQAKKWGHGGISAVSVICGLSRTTISKGIRELGEPQVMDGRIRRPGAGRPTLLRSDQELPEALSSLLEAGPGPAAGPGPPLSWTLKSTRALARELSESKHPISYVKAGQLLRDLGFCLKSNKRVGRAPGGADAALQYRLINEEVAAALDGGQPVIFLRRRALAPKAAPGPDSPGLRAGGEFPGVQGLAWGLISQWWDREGASLFPAFRMLLLIVSDSEQAGGPGEAWAAPDGALPRPVRVLGLPVGTHRWNLAMDELFSILSGQAAPGKAGGLETAAFLLGRDPRSLSGAPGRFVMGAPWGGAQSGSC